MSPRNSIAILLLVALFVAPRTGHAAPPFDGTVYLDPDIITELDPTTFTGITYAGTGSRLMFDRRPNTWVTYTAFLFNAQFSDFTAPVEVQVNPEFQTMAAALVEAEKYARVIGRLPTFLRTDVRTVSIHRGMNSLGGRNNNLLIHTGLAEEFVALGVLEEALVHEGAHTSLDAAHILASGWLAAQQADGEFISTYARDYQESEDIAESFLPYLAVRYRRDRIPPSLATTIEATIPNRLQYFDEQRLDPYPLVPRRPNRPLTRFGGPGGHLSFFFRHTTTGDVSTWRMNGTAIQQGVVLQPGLSPVWQIVGSPDLNGDGKPDVLFRNGATGDVAAWLMDGVTITQGAVVYPGLALAWQTVGLGDIDGDGRDDLVFRNTTTGDVSAWLMSGLMIRQGGVIHAGLSLDWQVVGIGDLTGDGKSDIVFRHTIAGDIAVWTMNGLEVSQGAVVFSGLSLDWQVTAIGDLDGDHRQDLVFRNTTTGDVSAWLMNGTTIKRDAVTYSGLDLAWVIAGSGDIDGDGLGDLIFRNATTGDVSAWLMSGLAIRSGAVIYGALSVLWQIT